MQSSLVGDGTPQDGFAVTGILHGKVLEPDQGIFTELTLQAYFVYYAVVCCFHAATIRRGIYFEITLRWVFEKISG
jgi:hypothetical protein